MVNAQIVNIILCYGQSRIQKFGASRLKTFVAILKNISNEQKKKLCHPQKTVPMYIFIFYSKKIWQEKKHPQLQNQCLHPLFLFCCVKKKNVISLTKNPASKKNTVFIYILASYKNPIYLRNVLRVRFCSAPLGNRPN